jgi:hypothetical protein
MMPGDRPRNPSAAASKRARGQQVMKTESRFIRFWKTKWDVYKKSWKGHHLREESPKTARERLDDSEFVQKMYLHKPGDLLETFP